MKRKSWLKVLITIFVVIIGIGAIGWFTWNIGRLFLDLVANSPVDEPEKANVTTDQILILPEFEFWTCQVGVFNNRNNALQMQETTLAKGWKAEIIQENPFVVAVGLFYSKEEATLCNQDMKEQGIESWVRNESFPELHYKVSGSGVERVLSTLRLSNSLLRGISKENLKEELAGDIDFLFVGECPEDLQALNDELYTILTTEHYGENLALHEDLLKLFVEYKLITTKFMPNS